jgi:SH3 domain protein
MKFFKCVLLGTLLAQASLALAETMYVTDLLRLGVHRAPDTSDRPFRTLVSGTPMEILQRSTNYAFVRLEDGREGWVKSAYLVDEKPARLRLAELEADHGDFQNQLDAARAAQTAAEAKASALESTMSSAANSSQAAEEHLRKLEDENASFQKRLASYRGSMPLTWVGLAVVVALVGGFVTGLWWLDYLSRRRHGGFRIY